MSSLNAILNTASNAVTAYQAAISVTGQNIANADNDDYSIQSAELSTTSTVTSRGNIYGTGVTVSSVSSSVNQIIENALTSELSSQAALEEAQVYMASIEDLFSEDSDDSLNTLLDAYWSAWGDLSNNPSGETEQNAVYDAGLALTKRINAIEEALSDLTDDLNSQISSAVTEVNNISEQIAGLNLAIITAESTGGNANDFMDERNALVDDLGERIDIDVTVKEDGTYLITTCGLPLVEDGISYDLSMDQGSVYWAGKSGNTYDITDDIPGGSIAGWLEVRDVIIPEIQAGFDELAANLIWTLNYQHSQGVGQTYFSGALEGTYEAGDSGTFDSLYYGDEIDYTKDFSMVIQDATGFTSEYQTVTVDMAISTSEISNISGQDNRTYEITVIDEGTLEEIVGQSSGSLLYWEILDSSGNSTGKSGYVEIDESGEVEIIEDGETTLSFKISEGSLVAGNTLRINTDEAGEADILQGLVTGTAASVDDTYEFTVISGGTLPDAKDDIVIQWTSETGSGTIELKDDKDEKSQITADVDGMTIAFDSGTLVNGDVFYVTTDENGKAVADADGNRLQTLSEWHWTLESFADEFNRSAGGVTASVTQDNTIVFNTHDDYCAIENITCSGSNNIGEENFEITVLNYSALEFEAEALEFKRTDGTWSVENDPTGGTIAIIPEDGNDDGFQIDLDGDDIGDIEITFDRSVSGDGYIRMDLKSRDADDLSYAFAGNEDGDSGLAAALGVNTFFTGTGASTISVNDVVSDGDLLASGIMDTETFELAAGDNTNALAMADTRYDSVDMKAYTYTRGEGVTVTVTATTLDDYQASLVSTIGSTAAGIDSALEYSETLVYQLTVQRDSISAVSLDEEMINLTAQQQAYLAAAKLLTTVQEMFDALLATR